MDQTHNTNTHQQTINIVTHHHHALPQVQLPGYDLDRRISPMPEPANPFAMRLAQQVMCVCVRVCVSECMGEIVRKKMLVFLCLLIMLKGFISIY